MLKNVWKMRKIYHCDNDEEGDEDDWEDEDNEDDEDDERHGDGDERFETLEGELGFGTL